MAAGRRGVVDLDGISDKYPDKNDGKWDGDDYKATCVCPQLFGAITESFPPSLQSFWIRRFVRHRSVGHFHHDIISFYGY